MERIIFEVVPSGSQWALRRQGSPKKEIFATRREAIASGRQICQENRPSRLCVRKSDPQTQD